MAFGSFIFDELKLSNSCYMAAAIEFNYAMFHIFNGPLFANLQGYAFFDLLIWGVSPILFEICRVPLRKQIKPPRLEGQQNYSRLLLKRRFVWLILCFVAILISYLFMNYSSTFRWNYFSRIVNLDFGYLLFDLACRCMELIVEIEEEEQQKMLIDQQRDTVQPFLHRGGYCKYRNIFMMASYFLVFYLSTFYDTGDQGSGKQIFRSLSVLSCIFTLAIPFLYLFRYRNEAYSPLQNTQEHESNQVLPIEDYPENDKKVYIIFGLVSFSFFINTSYFSLWIMESLAKENQVAYKQFNKTLLITSTFFLVASFLQFVVSHAYIGCKIKDGMFHQSQFLQRLVQPFLICYGLLMGIVFFFSTKGWHYIVISIIPFGFHYIILNYLCEIIAEWKEQNKKRYGHHKIFFLCQTTAYLIVPIVLSLCGLGDSAVRIFGYLSAASLLAAGLIV